MANGHANQRYTPQEVAQAILESYGILAEAARRLGCSRMAVYNYIRRYATCRAALAEAREIVGDRAEGRLFRAIAEGEPWAIQFYLSRQCRDRGYGDRLTIEGDPARPLRIVLRWDDGTPVDATPAEGGES